MALGPGKYDSLCTFVREQAQAKGVFVIVVDGARGSGFNAQVSDFQLQAALPSILRQTADDIEAAGGLA